MLRCQNTSEKATRPRPSQKESAQLLRLSGEPSGRRVAYNIVTGTSLIFALTARHFPSPYPSSSQSLSVTLLFFWPAARQLHLQLPTSSRVAFLLAINIPCTLTAAAAGSMSREITVN